MEEKKKEKTAHCINNAINKNGKEDTSSNIESTDNILQSVGFRWNLKWKMKLMICIASHMKL